MVDEQIFELIKEPKLFLSKEEAKHLKDESRWKEELWMILNYFKALQQNWNNLNKEYEKSGGKSK